MTQRGEAALLWLLGRILIELCKYRKHGGTVDRESGLRKEFKDWGIPL